MNKKAMEVLGMQLEWVIIIVALILGFIVLTVYLKHYASNWLPIK